MDLFEALTELKNGHKAINEEYYNYGGYRIEVLNDDNSYYGKNE